METEGFSRVDRGGRATSFPADFFGFGCLGVGWREAHPIKPTLSLFVLDKESRERARIDPPFGHKTQNIVHKF